MHDCKQIILQEKSLIQASSIDCVYTVHYVAVHVHNFKVYKKWISRLPEYHESLIFSSISRTKVTEGMSVNLVKS